VTAEVVLNEETYANLHRVMPMQAMQEVYTVCLSDARLRIEQMRTAAIENDRQLIRREAHAIKGGAGMVGATKLSQAAAALELDNYGSDDLSMLLDNLLCNCDELERILYAKWHP
jgi:HPt (histidine-containing phosphotransfer) domain-containing protein